MIGGIFSGLFFAFILALIGFDNILITALKELFDVTISTNTYYFVFAVGFGLKGWIENLVSTYKPKKHNESPEKSNFKAETHTHCSDTNEDNIVDVEFTEADK